MKQPKAKSLNQKDRRREFLELLLLFILFVAAWMALSGLLSWKHSDRPVSGRDFSHVVPAAKLPPGISESIDINLKRVDQGGEYLRIKAQAENEATLQSVSHDDPTELVREEKDYSITMHQDDTVHRIYNEINRDREDKQPPLHESPDARIQARVAHKKWQQDYEKAYTREFAKEFVRRASEDGYAVELNKDLQVVGLREKRKPQPLRFPQSIAKELPAGSSSGAQ